MSNSSWYKNGNVTPEDALKLAVTASANEDVQQNGVEIAANNLSDASLLYLAAKHLGLQIAGMKMGDEKAELSEIQLHSEYVRWHSFISEEKGKPAATPKKVRVLKPRNSRSALTAELDGLIGLKSVKQQVRDVTSLASVQALRTRKGLPKVDMSQHLVFTGKPGTGKTTVARIIGSIYRELGLLSSGHFTEIDGRGLIAEYIGQTAAKTEKVIGEAMDGVLFIDEAYTLAPEDIPNDFGAEAIATLIKKMEDNRDRLIVILAGYEKEMDRLLASNPGLKSRFKTKIEFPDYDPAELHAIFAHIAAEQAYVLSSEANKETEALFAEMHRCRGEEFGNGRSVRNAFERAVMNQARRLASNRRPNRKQLQLIKAEDIPALTELSW